MKIQSRMRCIETNLANNEAYLIGATSWLLLK